MTIIEQFEADYERIEADENMYYSVYYIPSYYQPEGEVYAV